MINHVLYYSSSLLADEIGTNRPQLDTQITGLEVQD